MHLRQKQSLVTQPIAHRDKLESEVVFIGTQPLMELPKRHRYVWKTKLFLITSPARIIIWNAIQARAGLIELCYIMQKAMFRILERLNGVKWEAPYLMKSDIRLGK